MDEKKQVVYDIAVVGAGPAGAVFVKELATARPDLKILLIDGQTRKRAGNTIINYCEENSQKPWVNAIQNGFNEYSSIYEIGSFDIDEILRIYNLYVDREIQGVYKKHKDPKFKEEE